MHVSVAVCYVREVVSHSALVGVVLWVHYDVSIDRVLDCLAMLVGQVCVLEQVCLQGSLPLAC